MKKNIFLFFSLLAIIWGHKFENCSAQGAAINIIGAAADSSAILDVNAMNQGILIPRFTGSGWYMLECNVPSITGQPVAQTICEGNNTSFSITATGAGLTYQWQLSTDGGSTWTNQANGGVYSNMNTATMNITNASAGMNAYQYHCVVGGTCTLAAISDAATLTVNPFPDITATPSSQTICSGATTDIALTSNVTGTTFAWTVAQSGVTGAADGSGSNILQTLTNSGIAAGTATYSITPTASGCSGTSTDVVITVNLLPDVTATPSSQAICSGSATGITLTSNVTGTAFAWTVVQSEVTGATEGSGSSIAQTLTNTGTTAGTATYSITPTASGCSGTSTDVVITVNPIPDVTATPSSQIICSGATTDIALTSNDTGTIFVWTVTQSSGITGASDGSGNSIAQTLTNSGTTEGTATYSITPTVSGCSGTSTDVVITVNPLPDVIATPSSQAICSGSATGITLTSNATETTFAWTVISNGVTGAFDGAGSSITQTLTNSTFLPGTATYTITPTAGTCAGTPTNVVITVNPIPNLQFSVSPSQTICSGSIPTITLTSNVTGTTFAWTVTQSGVTGATAGSGSSIAQTLTNSGTSAGTATYSITPTASGCIGGTSTNVVITVNPNLANLVNNAHTQCQCTAAGGTVVSDGFGNNMCRFGQATCVSGWTQYASWSTTTNTPGTIAAGSCGGYAWAECTQNVVGHSWANTPRECGEVFTGNWCDSGCGRVTDCRYLSCGTYTTHCIYYNTYGMCGWIWEDYETLDVYTSVTQIGCY